jgi:hypothetical protein
VTNINTQIGWKILDADAESRFGYDSIWLALCPVFLCCGEEKKVNKDLTANGMEGLQADDRSPPIGPALLKIYRSRGINKLSFWLSSKGMAAIGGNLYEEFGKYSGEVIGRRSKICGA